MLVVLAVLGQFPAPSAFPAPKPEPPARVASGNPDSPAVLGVVAQWAGRPLVANVMPQAEKPIPPATQAAPACSPAGTCPAPAGVAATGWAAPPPVYQPMTFGGGSCGPMGCPAPQARGLFGRPRSFGFFRTR